MANPTPTQLSPGVNVSEIDLSTFVEPQAFNSGGMAGVFNWGPCLVATRVSSESELAAIFGKPTLDQSDLANNSDFLAASNFLRYSPNLKVVRIVQDDDYNSVSQDVGVTWINSVDHKTIKNFDEFRSLGGFSGSAGIESKSHFKARYPGNFGDALYVVVYDGASGEDIIVDRTGYQDFALKGGYTPSNIVGISFGTAGFTLSAVYDEDGQGSFTSVPVANGGRTFGTANWYMVTVEKPNAFASAEEFRNAIRQRVDAFKFLYATGTTSQNFALTQSGADPSGNRVNYNPAALFADAFNGREFNPYHEFGIVNSNYTFINAPQNALDLFVAVNPTNSNYLDFLFWDADSQLIPSWRTGMTYTFGALGDLEIYSTAIYGDLTSSVSGIPSQFSNSIFNGMLNSIANSALSGGDRTPLQKYASVWSGIAPALVGINQNQHGWANFIGLTGSVQLARKNAQGTRELYSVTFDSNFGITGIKNNFAYGIVQFGTDAFGAFTETFESYDGYRLFDKMPGTSEYASQVGGSNDELSIAIVDVGGKFGPKGSILERFELLSKATDAKNLNGDSIYYKDYINNNSQYVYLTKPFGYTGGAAIDSTATTAFGDITSQKTASDGTVYTRNGYYDALLGFGESTATEPSLAEQSLAYSVFADDDSAVDVLFVPESSVSDDSSADVCDLEVQVYNSVIAQRKDTIFVVPTAKPTSGTQHSSITTNRAVAYRNSNLNLPANSYTMVVAGRKLFFDTFNNQIRKMSLSSDVAGILAAQEIPWESPAGFARGNLKNIIRLETKFSKGERDELYKNQINFFNEFNDGSGTVLFGDKTLLTKPSAFDRINVRRVFIAAEKAIAKAAKYSLFEFNDEFTRAQFRNLVIPFLRNLQSQKGIYDFKVVCDETNNTAQVIDNNQFVADIYIKPARSINFIQLNFIAVKSDFNLTTIE